MEFDTTKIKCWFHSKIYFSFKSKRDNLSKLLNTITLLFEVSIVTSYVYGAKNV